MHAEVRAILDRAIPAIHRALGDQVVAIYLWGSATLGGYRPGMSDVDIVVCLRADPTERTLAMLEPIHAELVDQAPEWRDRIEVAYVGVDSLQHFRRSAHPIARISPGEPLNLRMADSEWLIDWYQVRELGTALVGPPPAELLPPITVDELQAEAARQVKLWTERIPVEAGSSYLAYVVLAVCRGLHVVRTGTQVSKQDAGRWVAATYPEWRELTLASVAQQASEHHEAALERDAVVRFVRWAARESD